jgi:hypothetical protein
VDHAGAELTFGTNHNPMPQDQRARAIHKRRATAKLAKRRAAQEAKPEKTGEKAGKKA